MLNVLILYNETFLYSTINEMNVALSQNFATRLRTTWPDEINFGMNHVPGAGFITQPVDLQSSTLLLYYGCIPLFNEKDKRALSTLLTYISPHYQYLFYNDKILIARQYYSKYPSHYQLPVV